MKGHVYNLNVFVTTCNNLVIGNCGKLLLRIRLTLLVLETLRSAKSLSWVERH